MNKKSRSFLLSLIIVSGCMTSPAVIPTEPIPMTSTAAPTATSEMLYLLEEIELRGMMVLDDPVYWTWEYRPWKKELYDLLKRMEETSVDSRAEEITKNIRMGMELRDRRPIQEALEIIQEIR